MSDSAVIRIEGLGKRYRYGGAAPLGDSLRGELTGLVKRIVKGRKPHSTLNSQPSTSPDDPQFFWALKDVSFEVQKGEVVGIIGRNGAGKSTLLKILSRITPPTTGKITYHGRVASLLEVGTGFHRELTGRENVFLNGSILGMKRSDIARKFDEIVAFAELEKFIDTPVKFYSSGMYVRLAFGVAAHLEPDILVVDEVLAVGDAGFQRKCLGKIQDVSESGRTVLFVSHQMNMIARLCKRAVLLESGRVSQVGPAGPVVEQYLAKGTDTIEGVVDLSARPRPAHATGSVKILSAAIVSSTPILFGSQLELLVTFNVVKPVSQIELSFLLKTADGNNLSAVISGDSNGSILKAPAVGKTYQARVRIPACRWVPRPYRIALGARSGPNGTEDEVEVGSIEIVGIPENPSCFENRWDIYRPVVHWEFKIAS